MKDIEKDIAAGTGKDAVSRIAEFEKFGIVLGLERIESLLRLLGDPHKDMKVIHVAGTNGKGSVCRYIYEMLECNGYKVGIYTSPFIEKFEERIEFDHELITPEELEKYTDIVTAAAEKMKAEGLESPTEFEIVTAIAFCYYRDKSPDFVILEVGMGGRGDSTNVIEKPLVSIITSIGMDHMERLGNTLAEIAGEKAGIIKAGCPVVSNVSEREAAVVIARKCYEMGSVLHDCSKAKWGKIANEGTGSMFTAIIEGERYGEAVISMAGDHQIENAVAALTAIEILRKNSIIDVKKDKLYEGLKAAKQKGRFEPVGDGFVLDGAHNRDGMEALVKTVDDYYYGKKILVLMGILADKAVDDVVDLVQYIGDDFIVTEPPNTRRLEASKLAEKLERHGKTCYIEPDPAGAIKRAKEMKAEYDMVLCCGSLYLIGALRTMLCGE